MNVRNYFVREWGLKEEGGIGDKERKGEVGDV